MLLQAYQRLHQAGIEPDWAGGSLDGDLRGFIDARRSHCGIARQRELSSVVLPPSGSNTRHPLDVAHPALVGAGATRQVAILLAATPSMLRVYQPFINLWRCYALRHGLQFILETDDTEVRPPHRRAKNWIRWFAVRRHLDFYEALLVVDPDTFVVPECWNVSIPAVLGSTAAARRGQHASPDVGMRDFGRPQTLNNGVVLVRSTPRGRFFLDQLLAKAAWMQTIEKDQGAFDETVLEVLGLEALSRGEDGYDSECVQHVFPNARGNHEVALYALCWWRVSERLAGPFGARLSDTIRFADPRLADVNHVVGARGMSEPAVLHHFAGRSKDWDAMLDAFGVPPRQTMDCHAVHEHVHAAGAARLCVPGAAEVAECEDGLLVC
ncbi:unnamed protein product [Prorocentrum cordatum]|uniref:Hexosyltransferase n=1 Tax=Prorocentrum cordatum TaxID=2364126 RepID=A0ABN9UW78_9DINO|nr:unnamed protein product [Polarella glacialis]